MQRLATPTAPPNHLELCRSRTATIAGTSHRRHAALQAIPPRRSPRFIQRHANRVKQIAKGIEACEPVALPEPLHLLRRASTYQWLPHTSGS